jgi:hypothetical protein
VTYENGEPWWNDIGRGKLLIRPPQLSDYYTSSHLGAKHEELGEENDDFGQTKYLCSYFEGSLICRKILRHGTDVFTTLLKEGVLRIFIALENHRLGRV